MIVFSSLPKSAAQGDLVLASQVFIAAAVCLSISLVCLFAVEVPPLLRSVD